MKMRMMMIALVGLFMAGVAAGCAGTYTPRKDGMCNAGRTWVPPAKGEDGEWKAGYCTWAN